MRRGIISTYLSWVVCVVRLTWQAGSANAGLDPLLSVDKTVDCDIPVLNATSWTFVKSGDIDISRGKLRACC
jgi:hypothetical protein